MLINIKGFEKSKILDGSKIPSIFLLLKKNNSLMKNQSFFAETTFTEIAKQVYDQTLKSLDPAAPGTAASPFITPKWS